MQEKFRNFLLFIRAVSFTIVLHSALLSGLWWPFFSESKIERVIITPIKVQVFSEQEQEIKKQKQKLLGQKQVAKNLEELNRKQKEEQKHFETASKKKVDEEKKKKQEEKRKREEGEKKRTIAEKKRKEAELRKKLERERVEKERARIRNEAASALSALVNLISAAVEDNWRRPFNSGDHLVAIIRVKVSPSGEVISAKVVQSSGDKFFDQSAEIAVKKASPLPFPSDSKYYEYINVFNFKFNPDDI